jgi:hypothetical protein
MLVLCRVCQKQAEPSPLLTDVCNNCYKIVIEIQAKAWEDEHGPRPLLVARSESGVRAQEADASIRKQGGAYGASHGPVTRTRGVGTAIETVTKALGITSCSACQRRRDAMNAVRLDAPLTTVLVGLVEAALNPERTLDAQVDIEREEGGSPANTS